MSASTGDPAPGEARWTALALVNTEHIERGRLVDSLDRETAIADWLVERGLLVAGTQVDGHGAQKFRDVRSAVREALESTAGGQPPSPQALPLLNEASAAAPGMRSLLWRSDRLVGSWQAVPGTPPLDVALARLADGAIELVSNREAGLLRRCEAHGCVRLFLQEHARRRWCSRRCGDRVRVARHYKKAHPGT